MLKCIVYTTLCSPAALTDSNGAQERYRDHVRPPVFSHEGLIITLAQWLAATAAAVAGTSKSSKAITSSSSSSSSINNNSSSSNNNNSSSSDHTSGDESDSPPPPPTTRSAARAAGAAAAAATAATASRARCSPPRIPLKRGRLPPSSSSSAAVNGHTTNDSDNESGYASPGSSTCNSPTLPAAGGSAAAATAATAAVAAAATAAAAAAAEAAATLERAIADGLIQALLIELRTIGTQAAALRASAEAAGCEDFDEMAVFFEQMYRTGSGRRSPGRGTSTGNYSPFKSGSRFGTVKQAGWEAQLSQSGREMGPIDGPRCCVCKQYCYMEVRQCVFMYNVRLMALQQGFVLDSLIASVLCGRSSHKATLNM
jgi:hypothetical protein